MSAFSLTTATNIFKRKFWKMSDAVFNASNVTWSRINKNSDFVGKDMFVSNPMSFSGGVGSGALPTANVGKYEGSIINSKKIYAVCQVEREAIKASEQSEGAFVKAMAETVKKTLESFMRNMSRQLFADGTAILGKGDGILGVYGTGSVATPYVLSLSVANFFDANLEERDLVNIVTALGVDNTGGTAEATALEITAVDVVKYTVSLVGTSAVLAALVAAGTTYITGTVSQSGTVITGVGTTFVIGMIGATIVYSTGATSVITGFTSTTVMAAATSQTVPALSTFVILYGANKLLTTVGFAMQNSYLNDITGLRGIANQSLLGSGSIYSVAVQRRWSMGVYDALAAAVSVDLINQEMLKIERKSGKVPNLIVCGFKQYQKMLALHENQKRYPVSPKDSKYSAQFSFDGLQFMSTAGVVAVVYDRFVKDDEIWLLNDNYITITMRPGGVQWFEEDGTVFLRDTGSDSYSARYGGYMENYVIPTFHGQIKNLAV
jgi:hypothetical protein